MKWRQGCVLLLVVSWVGMAATLLHLIVFNVTETKRVVSEPDAANGMSGAAFAGGAGGISGKAPFILSIPTVQVGAGPGAGVAGAALPPVAVPQPIASLPFASPPQQPPQPVLLPPAAPAPVPVIASTPIAALDSAALGGGHLGFSPTQQTMRRTLAEILPELPIGSMPPTPPAFNVANSALPPVTVMSPLCTGRRKWFPNLYAMFAHQNYPGKLQLLLLDGRCAKMPEEIERSAFWDAKAKEDTRVRYEFLGPAVKGDMYPPVDPNGRGAATAVGPINMTLGAKRNWLALNAEGEIIITFDCDDYYGPSYVSRMVAAFLEHPNADFVKLHAWFSLGERWAYDPLRRLHDWTYINMEKDPLPWGWTYNYRRKLFTEDGQRFGDLDASEEGGFFKGIPLTRIYTFADQWFTALRIVTRFVARTTGARRCDYCGPGGNDHPCFQLPEFVALMGFGGEAKIKPWLDMWNVEH